MNGRIITALEVQKRNKKRVNVYLDGEYVLSLTLDEAVKLRKGQVLSETEIAALQSDDEVIRTVDRAVRFLGVRPRSVAEIRRNLTQKDVPPTVIDSALERLQAFGYLDDVAFAKFWVQNRTTFKPISTAALRYELQQKGVSSAIIAEVLDEVDNEDAAYQAARLQSTRLRGRSRGEFRTKLTAFLQRRGFRYSDARRAIEQLMAELEDDESGFFSGDTEDEM